MPSEHNNASDHPHSTHHLFTTIPLIMRTPRRPRRSGIRYIEDANSRSISFSKRRDGLFKMAANLSTLTGARIAIVAEAENGKMSSFSAPSLGPIVDSFLSEEDEAGGAAARAPPQGPDDREKDAMARLQRELAELEEKKAAQEQRAADSLARVKAIRDGSRMGKLIVCSKVDDLCADDLHELLRGLSRVDQEIRALLPPPAPARTAEAGGLMRGRPPPPLHSQGRPRPPRRLPWVSSQSQPPSLPILRAPCTLPQSFSLTSPPVQQPSSLRTISRMLLRHIQLSQRSSSMVPRLPNEAHQYSYQSQGVAAIAGNISGQTSLLPSPPPLPISALQIPSQRSLQLEVPSQALDLNPDVPASQNHANPHSVLENSEVSHGGIGGDQQQPSPGCPSDSNGKTYEWLSKTLLESSSEGGSSSDEDDGVGDSLGGVDWLGDN
jgi:hypothetical protein